MGEDQALERLREILARPEFQVEQSRPWWERLLAPVIDLGTFFIARVVQIVIDASSGREGWLGVAVLALCAVLTGLVVAYLVRAIRLSVTRESGVRAVSLAGRRERSERLWQSAHQLAAMGQLSEAVRMLYLSALYALDERALLRVESALTNREHARALSRVHPEVASSFADVVDSYDRLRYGRFPISESIFAELSARVARARSASLQGSASDRLASRGSTS
jgi:hypothetical protein